MAVRQGEATDRTLVKTKPRVERNRVLVTGGAGFVGSHLCEFLVNRGDHVSVRTLDHPPSARSIAPLSPRGTPLTCCPPCQVICLDNFFTGSKENLSAVLDKPNFELVRHDVVEPILLEVDQIYHLACPASPVHYKYGRRSPPTALRRATPALTPLSIASRRCSASAQRC